jgi:hypothetical protein
VAECMIGLWYTLPQLLSSPESFQHFLSQSRLAGYALHQATVISKIKRWRQEESEGTAEEHRELASQVRLTDDYKLNSRRWRSLILTEEEASGLAYKPVCIEEVYPNHSSQTEALIQRAFSLETFLGCLQQPPAYLRPPSNLLFLVHGLHGSSLDLYLLESKLSLLNPHLRMLCCTAASKPKPEEGIACMGRQLANEMIAEIESHEKYIGSEEFTISCIGFSLGGLLIREALTHLKKYRPRFGTLLTICTPHLGAGQSKSTIFNLGTRPFIRLLSSNELEQRAGP